MRLSLNRVLFGLATVGFTLASASMLEAGGPKGGGSSGGRSGGSSGGSRSMGSQTQHKPAGNFGGGNFSNQKFTPTTQNHHQPQFQKFDQARKLDVKPSFQQNFKAPVKPQIASRIGSGQKFMQPYQGSGFGKSWCGPHGGKGFCGTPSHGFCGTPNYGFGGSFNHGCNFGFGHNYGCWSPSYGCHTFNYGCYSPSYSCYTPWRTWSPVCNTSYAPVCYSPMVCSFPTYVCETTPVYCQPVVLSVQSVAVPAAPFVAPAQGQMQVAPVMEQQPPQRPSAAADFDLRQLTASAAGGY